MAARLAYRTILVATDFSDPAHAALERGLDLARRLGAKVELVYVTPKLEPAVPFHRRNRRVVAELQAQQKQAAEEALAQLARVDGVKVRPRVLVGRPSEAILAHAKRIRADLVVLAKHGHTLTQRLLIGSVTERVLREASLPVLVVPIRAGRRR